MQNRTSRNAFTKTLRSKPDDPSYRIAPRSQIASQSDSETQHVSGVATPWGHRVNPFKCGSVGRTPYRLVKWSLEIPWFPPLAGASPSCPVTVRPGSPFGQRLRSYRQGRSPSRRVVRCCTVESAMNSRGIQALNRANGGGKQATGDRNPQLDSALHQTAMGSSCNVAHGWLFSS
jgi:hypothetical protein